MTESQAPTSVAARLAGLAGTTVTFVFTDIEDSTPLLKRLGDRYADVSADHRRLVRAAFATHGGIEVDTQGDAFFFAFRRARDAAMAAVEAQVALANHPWPDGVAVRVRMGMNSGEPLLHEEGLVGLSVVRGSRICAAGHGGQVLVSESSAALLRDHLPAGVGLRDLGVHRLKGLDDPQRLFQLSAPGLAGEFRPIRIPSRRSRSKYVAAGALVALLAAGAVTAAVLLRDSKSVLTIPVDSLAAIDARTGRVLGVVPVGKGPTGVAYSRGTLWVPNSQDATVTVVNAGNHSAQTVSLGRPSDAHPVAISAGSAVWVALGIERQLLQIDQRFVGQLVGDPVATDQEPLSVLVVADRVCAAVTIRVECFRAHDGTSVGSTHVIDTGAAALAFGAGTLWVGGQNAVTQFTPGALEAIGVPIAVPGRVTGIAFGHGSIWVAAVTGAGAAQGAGTVSRLAPGASAPISTSELDGRPTAVAYGQDAAWVAVDNGTLVRFDAKTDAETTIEVGHHPTAVDVGGGRVWVTVGS